MSNAAGFGGRLREERERRKIPLASIAGTTKISVALLEGLERGDVSRWPSGIFRRSFVRAYAQAIGLDADATVAEFLECFPDREDEVELAASARSPRAPEAAPARPPRAPEAPIAPAARAHAVCTPVSDRLRANASAAARAIGVASTGAWTSASKHAAGLADRVRAADPYGRARRARSVAANRLRTLEAVAFKVRIVEAVRAFQRGAIVPATRGRWAAAAWDAGVLLAIALVLFVVVNSFWKPFGVLTLTYYIGGILILGNTPGVCLFGDERAATSNDGHGGR